MGRIWLLGWGLETPGIGNQGTLLSEAAFLPLSLREGNAALLVLYNDALQNESV